MSLLAGIPFLPFLAALVVMLLPGTQRFLIRLASLAATFLSAVMAVVLFVHFDPSLQGFQHEVSIPWVQSMGISLHFGVDGVSVGLVLMAALVGFASVCASWEIQSREKEFYILLLLMISGILAAFASTDIFFFYFFHEFALIPTFIMIGIWGKGGQKRYAAFKMTLYLSVGALVALVGLVALYAQSGAGTFDMEGMARHLRRNPLSDGAQMVLFPLLIFGFGILVSLWPLHTWAPIGYANAPTPAAMMHAGVIKKFGLYGILRVAMPFLPEGAAVWMPLVAFIALGNILYCGWVAMRQKGLDWLLGNSSVAHMGFVFLGLASLNVIGITGAVVIMIAHGLLAALGFGLAGYLRQYSPTLDMSRFGGLLKQAPFVGGALLIALLAGCGLPGFANFVGEVMVFFGAWDAYPLVTVFAVWGGLVIGGVYMMRAARHLLHGEAGESTGSVMDAIDAWRRFPYVLLIVALLVFGFAPSLLTRKIEPAAERITAMSTGFYSGVRAAQLSNTER